MHCVKGFKMIFHLHFKNKYQTEHPKHMNWVPSKLLKNKTNVHLIDLKEDKKHTNDICDPSNMFEWKGVVGNAERKKTLFSVVINNEAICITM